MSTLYIIYIYRVELTHYLEARIQAIWMQVWLDFTTSLSQTALQAYTALLWYTWLWDLVKPLKTLPAANGC